LSLSRDASLLALATDDGIEIWDARIGQRHHVIQCQASRYPRPVAFSLKGELIVSDSKDGIVVVDVRAGKLMPTIYSSSLLQGPFIVHQVGISFDLSMLAALISRNSGAQISVWDIPSGALLHSLKCTDFGTFQWSCTDQYLVFQHRDEHPRYLNTETFQEEVLEPGDHFQQPVNHLYCGKETLRICGKEGPLFLLFPSHLIVHRFASRGDRVCILSKDSQLLLLDTSGLEAYMEQYDLQFKPVYTAPFEGRYII